MRRGESTREILRQARPWPPRPQLWLKTSSWYPKLPPSNGNDISPKASTASSRFFPRDEYFMRLALREATRAVVHDDIPVGAVVVHDGEVIATGHNEREVRAD